MKSRPNTHSFAVFGLAAALLAASAAHAEAPAAPPGWIADPATGCRVWSDSPQPGQSVTWSGACSDGVAQGQGVAQWSGAGSLGRRYEGELRDGKESGEGSEIFASGSRYDGELRDGKRDGHGAYTYASGDRYDGMFRNGHYNGPGRFTWADGKRYEGNFTDDLPSGRGVFTWPEGDRYEGEFRRGLRAGHGIAIFANGGRYDGEWRDGRPNGAGVYLNGRERFSGNWVEGCFHDGGHRAFVAVAAAACR